MREAIDIAVQGRDLDEDLMEKAMEAILAGEASGAQIAGFIVALRMKGEEENLGIRLGGGGGKVRQNDA